MKIFSTTPTLKEFIEEVYLPHKLLIGDYTESTASYTKKYFRTSFPEFYAKKLNKVTDEDVKTWLKTMKGTFSPRAMNNRLYYAYEYAIELNYIAKNPISKCKMGEAKKSGRIIPKEEVNKLLDYFKLHNTRMYLATKLAINCCLRRGEICGLLTENIHHDRIEVVGQIVKPTGEPAMYTPLLKSDASRREIPLTPSFAKELKALAGDKYVIEGHSYEFLDPQYITTVFRETQDLLGIKRKRFHDLRHTFISVLFDNRVNPAIIQVYAGHKNLSTTLNTYTHIVAKDNKAVSLIDEYLK